MRPEVVEHAAAVLVPAPVRGVEVGVSQWSQVPYSSHDGAAGLIVPVSVENIHEGSRLPGQFVLSEQRSVAKQRVQKIQQAAASSPEGPGRVEASDPCQGLAGESSVNPACLTHQVSPQTVPQKVDITGLETGNFAQLCQASAGVPQYWLHFVFCYFVGFYSTKIQKLVEYKKMNSSTVYLSQK